MDDVAGTCEREGKDDARFKKGWATGHIGVADTGKCCPDRLVTENFARWRRVKTVGKERVFDDTIRRQIATMDAGGCVTWRHGHQ
jgi:hypothetical protein